MALAEYLRIDSMAYYKQLHKINLNTHFPAGYSPLIGRVWTQASIFWPTVDVILMMCPIFFRSGARIAISLAASRVTKQRPMTFVSIILLRSLVLSSVKINPLDIQLALFISKSIPSNCSPIHLKRGLTEPSSLTSHSNGINFPLAPARVSLSF